jgi:iron complex outermembrane receptor protein
MNKTPIHWSVRSANAAVWLAFLFFSAAKLSAQAVAGSPESAAKQASDETLHLSVFEVKTSSDIGYQTMNAAEATRMNTPIEDIPMNVTIFNQQFINDLLATSSEAVLEYEPSAVKTSENDAFMARGSSSVSTNFLNGFAQTAGGTGSQPLANIERVEVIKGPAAVLYGSGGFGGTFNRITKQPLPNPFTSARLIVRDQSSYRVEIDHGGPIPSSVKNRFLYRINGIIEDSSSYNGIPRKESMIAPSFTWNVSKDTKLTLEYFRHKFERQANWEFPIIGGDPKGIRDAGGTYHSYDNHKWSWGGPDDIRSITRQVASLDFRHIFTANIQFRSQVQAEFIDQFNQEVAPENLSVTLLQDAVLMGGYWRTRPETTDNYRTRNELIAQFNTGPLRHRLLLGHGWIEQYDRLFTDRAQSNWGGLAAGSAALEGDGRTTSRGNAFNEFPNLTLAQFVANPKLAGFNPNLILPVNVFDPKLSPVVPNLAFRPALYPDADTKTYNTNQDFYVNDLVSLFGERVFLLGGARQARYDRRTINYLAGTFPFKVRLASAPTVKASAEATTSSFGAVWHLNAAKTLSLYGNLNSAFEPEYRQQPDGEPLDPVVGKQKEVGMRFSMYGGRLLGLVTYFDILQDNVTQSDPTRTGYFIQVKGLRSTGSELSLNMRITDSWLMFGGYTYTDSRQESSGIQTAQQPKHRLALVNRYSPKAGPLKGFGFTLGTTYTGSRPVPALTTPRFAPEWTIPAALKLDFIVNYRIPKAKGRPGWEIGAKFSNLLDETIIYAATGGRYSVDPGREYQLVCGLRY